MKLHKLFAFFLISILVLVGCNPTQPAAAVTPVPYPTPTIHSMFSQPSSQTPLVLAFPKSAETGVISERSGSLVSAEEDFPVQAAVEELRTVIVYDENIQPPWHIFSPGGMTFNPISTRQSYEGTRSIEVTPTLPESKLYIALMPRGQVSFPREQVIGISFWLYSGEEELDLYDLAVTAIGSNEYPYYQVTDRSGENQKPYEETFLYWLGFNDNIPPQTWVEVQIWLNEMLYDPEYRYVTGLYLTNRFNFKRTFYIDNVSLILSDSVLANEDTADQNAETKNAAQEDIQPTRSHESLPPDSNSEQE
jgi:hypothetical protein